MASQHDIINSQHDSKAGAQRVLNVDENGAKFTPAKEETLQSIADAKYTDDDGTYISYLNRDGSWLIMKLLESGGARWARGSSDYASAWESRAELEYKYYNLIF